MSRQEREEKRGQKRQCLSFSLFSMSLTAAHAHLFRPSQRGHGLSSYKLLRVAVPSKLRVSLHAWRLPRRFKNASTHGEILSNSDKAGIVKVVFKWDTKLSACQSSHALPSLACVTGFAGVPCFRNFRARGRDEFFRTYSRWAPITFDTL